VDQVRLRDISTVEAANAWAPSFIAAYNARFAKPRRSTFDGHRPLRADANLDLLMTRRHIRRVTKSLTMQYDPVMYLLEDTPANRRLIHHYIDVWEYSDGRIEIRADGESCPAGSTTGSRTSTRARSSSTSTWRTCWGSRRHCRRSVETGASPFRLRARIRGSLPVGRSACRAPTSSASSGGPTSMKRSCSSHNRQSRLQSLVRGLQGPAERTDAPCPVSPVPSTRREIQTFKGSFRTATTVNSPHPAFIRPR